jgi:hypothetical protein
VRSASLRDIAARSMARVRSSSVAKRPSDSACATRVGGRSASVTVSSPKLPRSGRLRTRSGSPSPSMSTRRMESRNSNGSDSASRANPYSGCHRDGQHRGGRNRCHGNGLHPRHMVAVNGKSKQRERVMKAHGAGEGKTLSHDVCATTLNCRLLRSPVVCMVDPWTLRVAVSTRRKLRSTARVLALRPVSGTLARCHIFMVVSCLYCHWCLDAQRRERQRPRPPRHPSPL